VHPFHILLLSANLLGLGLILWRGEWIDRAATLALVSVVAVTSLLQLLHVPGLMIWAAVLDILLFFTFWALAERGGRWWIVALAGFQFIAVVAYLAPFFAWERLEWAVVSVNWAVWALDSLCVFFGVWEASYARRFAREQADGARMDAGRRAGAPASME
jgi:signal transduction histidine kinase